MVKEVENEARQTNLAVKKGCQGKGDYRAATNTTASTP
jgi:hypothetical protein